jgi:hypothetical protein
VTLTLEDTNVGTTTALEDGSFSSSIALPLVSIGVHDVVATCADVTIHTPITVVLSTSAPESGETALGAVLGFFVLLALAFILIRPQSGVTLGALPGRAVDD